MGDARDLFARFARTTAHAVGHANAFLFAFLIVLAWAVTGPIFHFSDTWQLVINTGTTIVTFLMVFLIQNTQNRDAKSLHLKLDELIRGVQGARTGLVALEELSDSELDDLQRQFERLRKRKSASVTLPPHEAEQTEKAVATVKGKHRGNGNRNGSGK